MTEDAPRTPPLPALLDLLRLLAAHWNKVKNRIDRLDNVRIDETQVTELRHAIAVAKGYLMCEPPVRTIGELHNAVDRRLFDAECWGPANSSCIIRRRRLQRRLIPVCIGDQDLDEYRNLSTEEAVKHIESIAKEWEEKHEQFDDAFHDHPFPRVIEWVETRTGIHRDEIRDAAVNGFGGHADLVNGIRAVDNPNATKPLWKRLVKEHAPLLEELGLLSTGAEQIIDLTELGTASHHLNVIEELERETPQLDTKSVKWLAARKKNEKKIGLLLHSLRTYRLPSGGGSVMPDKMFGIDRDGRRWRRQGTPTSMVYYYVPSLPKSVN